MALSPAIGATALFTSDLIIDITPHFICRYYGTSAQLVAEGLIPAGLQWPLRNRRVSFEDAQFTYWLERNRVPGTKGPMSSWIDGDYWVLDITPKGQRLDWKSRQIQIKQREIDEIKSHGTSGWAKTWSAAYKAKQDDRYMAFRTRLLGEMAPRKRGRPAKNTATQTQGLAHV